MHILYIGLVLVQCLHCSFQLFPLFTGGFADCLFVYSSTFVNPARMIFRYAALLYESLRRKPGWRFTAGIKFELVARFGADNQIDLNDTLFWNIWIWSK